MMPKNSAAGFQRIVSSTRWTLPVPLWAVIVVFGWEVAAELLTHSSAAAFAIAVYIAQAVTATVITARFLSSTDAPEPPLPLKAAVTVLSGVALVVLPPVIGQGWLSGLHTFTAFVPAVIPAAIVWAMGPWHLTGTLAVLSCLPVAAHPNPPTALAAVAGTWVVSVLVVRLYASSITVMQRLDNLHRAEARLAIVEERLRFARDLHDTLGRTMAVIALKSELGARLADDDRARSEMADVQKLARSSQEEIREVVRGYHRVDLVTELEGAHSVLTAAGIVCRLPAADDLRGLEEEERSVLGWVVREGVTNVIRHSQASYCTLSIESDRESTTLYVVNNGAGRATGAVGHGDGKQGEKSGQGSGVGMTGLKQRLADRGGTLAHGHDGESTYHLRARVPRRQEHP